MMVRRPVLGSALWTDITSSKSAQRASAVWYTADILSELTEAEMDGCAAIAAVCPHPMRGKLRPSEDDVKARLEPYYDRVIASKHNPKLFYATFSTLEAAVAALHRNDLTKTDAGLVVEVYDCATVWVTVSNSWYTIYCSLSPPISSNPPRGNTKWRPQCLTSWMNVE